MTETATPSTVPVSDVPSKPLYDKWTAIIATLLGSPLAGMAVMALNYKRVGDTKAAIQSVVGGVSVVILLAVLGIFFPDASFTKAVGFGALGGMIAAANSQAKALEPYRQAGAKRGSRWVGVAIGAAVLVIVALPIFLYVAVFGEPGTRLAVGQNDEIYYSGDATESEARTLANALTESGFFQDQGTTVHLFIANGQTTLSFFVRNGGWNDREVVGAFEALTREVAPSVSGLPVKLRLLDGAGDVKNERLVH